MDRYFVAYPARVVRVIDGDSLIADVDLGFHIQTRQRFRLRNINCPELSDHPIGRLCKSHVEDLLEQSIGHITIRPYKADSFGRWLADVLLPSVPGEFPDDEHPLNLAHWLIDHGQGVAWNGRGKKPSPWIRDDGQQQWPGPW